MINDMHCNVAKSFEAAQRLGGVRHMTLPIEPAGALRNRPPSVRFDAPLGGTIDFWGGGQIA